MEDWPLALWALYAKVDLYFAQMKAMGIGRDRAGELAEGEVAIARTLPGRSDPFRRILEAVARGDLT